MKKIITAIDNIEINKLLEKEKNLSIISKDISYKEGILEQLEKNKKVDLIIIDERIDGEIELNQLIRKIKEKIRNIEMIIITENKNKVKQEIGRFKKIEIYETNKLKIKKLLKLININETEEIEEENYQNKKIISISGAGGIGKTTISIIFSKMNLKNNNLIIDYNENKNQDIPTIFNIENKNDIQKINKNLKFISTNKITKIKNILNKDNYENIIIDMENKIENKDKEIILKKCNKNIIIIESNLLGIKKGKEIINNYIEELNIKKNKILILINKKNKYSIDKVIIKNIFKEIKIIGEINNNIKYGKLLNNEFRNLELQIDKNEKANIRKIMNKIA